MTTRGTDWEKWLYRVVIAVGLVFGYVTAHPNKLRYWLYAWRDVPLVVVVPPVMAVAIWIVVRGENGVRNLFWRIAPLIEAEGRRSPEKVPDTFFTRLDDEQWIWNPWEPKP